MDVKREALCRD